VMEMSRFGRRGPGGWHGDREDEQRRQETFGLLQKSPHRSNPGCFLIVALKDYKHVAGVFPTDAGDRYPHGTRASQARVQVGVIGKTLMLASIGIATGTVASFMIPTRRASRIHPMIALRNS
jgi:hypothetical protein